MSDDEREYLWKHFAFNAEQRLRAFHFFVVFSGFANGGILAAFDKNSQLRVSLTQSYSPQIKSWDFLCWLSHDRTMTRDIVTNTPERIALAG
jgi:hypothetical protein